MNSPIQQIDLPHPTRTQFYPPDRGYSWAIKMYERMSQWGAQFAATYNSAGQGVGPTIASADIITVTAEIHHVTGTASIRQINLGAQQFSGPIVLIADDTWELVTGGNIAAGARPTVGTHVQIVLDNLIIPQTWYPVSGGLSSRDYLVNQQLVFVSGAIWDIPVAFLAGTQEIFRNGVLQSPGATFDYTISNGTVTFNAGRIPDPTDDMRFSALRA